MCAQVQERMHTHINMHRYMVEHRPLCAHTCKHTSKDTYKETYKDAYKATPIAWSGGTAITSDRESRAEHTWAHTETHLDTPLETHCYHI